MGLALQLSTSGETGVDTSAIAADFSFEFRSESRRALLAGSAVQALGIPAEPGVHRSA